MKENKGSKGTHHQSYVSSLQEANPAKPDESDWWDKMCKSYGEKNHFPKKKKEPENKDEDTKKNKDTKKDGE